jgi:hypothetical protein
MAQLRYALAASFAVALLAGCGSAADKATEALAEQARQAADGDTATGPAQPGTQEIRFQTEEGTLLHVQGEHVALPDDFPADIGLPEGYTLVSVMTMGATQSLVLQSKQGLPSLFEHFQTGQASRGWTETLSMQGTGGWMLGFEKENRGLLVNLSSDVDGRTVVSLSVQAR